MRRIELDEAGHYNAAEIPVKSVNLIKIKHLNLYTRLAHKVIHKLCEQQTAQIVSNLNKSALNQSIRMACNELCTKLPTFAVNKSENGCLLQAG